MGLVLRYMFFMKFPFSFYLTATQTLTFGYIKWTLDVAFTGSLFDILFGPYVSHENGKKTATKDLE